MSLLNCHLEDEHAKEMSAHIISYLRVCRCVQCPRVHHNEGKY